jgi:CheY-like chemotaxis protein
LRIELIKHETTGRRLILISETRKLYLRVAWGSQAAGTKSHITTQMPVYRAIFARPARNSGDPITVESNSPQTVTWILVVDDFKPYRHFVTSMLHGRSGLQVICGVSNGLDAVEKAQELKPDLVLLDIGLPGLNGIEAARRIRALAPNSKIIFLTQESSPEVMQEAKSLGAYGYVLKMQAETDLLAAVEAVLHGKQFFNDGTGGRGGSFHWSLVTGRRCRLPGTVRISDFSSTCGLAKRSKRDAGANFSSFLSL